MAERRVYQLTPAVYARLESRGIWLVCYKCNKPLKVGDTVKSNHRKAVKGMCHTKMWHNSCWLKAFI